MNQNHPQLEAGHFPLEQLAPRPLTRQNAVADLNSPGYGFNAPPSNSSYNAVTASTAGRSVGDVTLPLELEDMQLVPMQVQVNSQGNSNFGNSGTDYRGMAIPSNRHADAASPLIQTASSTVTMDIDNKRTSQLQARHPTTFFIDGSGDESPGYSSYDGTGDLSATSAGHLAHSPIPSDFNSPAIGLKRLHPSSQSAQEWEGQHLVGTRNKIQRSVSAGPNLYHPHLEKVCSSEPLFTN
jgi:hypothetical protein